MTGQKPPHDIEGGSRPDSPSTAICATIVGDRESHLGNVPLKLNCEIGERRRWGSKMTLTKLTSALLAVGLLAGCANLQMMANAQRAEAAKAEAKQAETECMAIFEDPRLDVIRPKVPFRYDEVTARHLAMQEVPTAEERDALLVYADLGMLCDKKLMRVYQTYWPYAVPVLIGMKQRGKLTLSYLINGNITYGEAFRLGQESYSKGIQKIAEIERELGMMATAQREAELDRQVQRSRTLTEAGTQLLIHSQPPPSRTTFTNCHWLGNNLSCTTR